MRVHRLAASVLTAAALLAAVAPGSADARKKSKGGTGGPDGAAETSTTSGTGGSGGGAADATDGKAAADSSDKATAGSDKDKENDKPAAGAAGAASGGAEGAVAPPVDYTGAGATTPPPAGGSSTPFGAMVPSLSHRQQFGLALLFGSGYRIIAPYKDNITCGDQNDPGARVCTNRLPFFMDIEASFGFTEHWDIFLPFRLGIETDFNTRHQTMVMPGFRYWLDPENHSKFFVAFQFLYDFTGLNKQPGVRAVDIGFRNSNGIMIEVVRNFGVYFQFGETIGLLRWFSLAVDGGVGAQVRLP